MSEPEHSSEQWRQSVQDMIRFCESISGHTNGIDKPTLVDSPLIYEATFGTLSSLEKQLRMYLLPSETFTLRFHGV